MIFEFNNTNSGFTLIELILIIAVLGILSVMGIGVLGDSVDEERFAATILEMKQIRNSLLGNAQAINLGVRTQFGYLGDVGDLPTEAQGLAAILSIPTGVSAFAINSTASYSMGWNGPYLVLSNPGMDITTDAFGNAYIYVNDGVNPTSITSRGADGAAGGTGLDQDIVVLLPDDLRNATVHGYILNNGTPYQGDAIVELYASDGAGDLTTDTFTISASDEGHFEFSDVPFGFRSVKISIPNTTTPSLVMGPTLFTVDSPNVTINPQAFDVGPAQNSTSGQCSAGLAVASSGLTIGGTGNKTLSFDVDLAENVDVSRIYVATSADNSALEEYNIQSNNYRCTGSQTFTACPLNEETTGELNNAMSLSSATGIPFALEFNTDMTDAATGVFTFRLYYDGLGVCDEIRI